MAIRYKLIFVLLVAGGLEIRSAASNDDATSIESELQLQSPIVREPAAPKPNPADVAKHAEEVQRKLKTDDDGDLEHETITLGEDEQGNPTRTTFRTIVEQGKTTGQSTMTENDVTGKTYMHIVNYAYHPNGKVAEEVHSNASHDIDTNVEKLKSIRKTFDEFGNPLEPQGEVN